MSVTPGHRLRLLERVGLITMAGGAVISVAAIFLQPGKGPPQIQAVDRALFTGLLIVALGFALFLIGAAWWLASSGWKRFQVVMARGSGGD